MKRIFYINPQGKNQVENVPTRHKYISVNPQRASAKAEPCTNTKTFLCRDVCEGTKKISRFGMSGYNFIALKILNMY